jgi:hypothetical protein
MLQWPARSVHFPAQLLLELLGGQCPVNRLEVGVEDRVPAQLPSPPASTRMQRCALLACSAGQVEGRAGGGSVPGTHLRPKFVNTR